MQEQDQRGVSGATPPVDQSHFDPANNHRVTVKGQLYGLKARYLLMVLKVQTFIFLLLFYLVDNSQLFVLLTGQLIGDRPSSKK